MLNYQRVHRGEWRANRDRTNEHLETLILHEVLWGLQTFSPHPEVSLFSFRGPRFLMADPWFLETSTQSHFENPSAAPRIAGPIATEGDVEHNLLMGRMDLQHIKWCTYFSRGRMGMDGDGSSGKFMQFRHFSPGTKWVIQTCILHTRTHVPHVSKCLLCLAWFCHQEFLCRSQVMVSEKNWANHEMLVLPFLSAVCRSKRSGCIQVFDPFRAVEIASQTRSWGWAMSTWAANGYGSKYQPPKKSNGFYWMLLQTSATKPTNMRVERTVKMCIYVQ